jgi:hypothetical protein
LIVGEGYLNKKKSGRRVLCFMLVREGFRYVGLGVEGLDNKECKGLVGVFRRGEYREGVKGSGLKGWKVVGF